MLIELYGANFGCFRDEFSLSMLATDIDPGSCKGVVSVDIDGDAKPLRLLRSVAIYGPNASGKSTVLRAANALRFLLENSAQLRSDQRLLPYEPFALDAAHRDAPVSLALCQEGSSCHGPVEGGCAVRIAVGVVPTERALALAR